MSIMPSLAVMIALSPTPGGNADVSAWLIQIRPALIDFGYNAEASRDCERYPAGMDEGLVASGGFGDVMIGLTGPETRFARVAVVNGRAGAILDLRKERERVCGELTPERLANLRVHYMTPIWKWPDRG